jgi:hypothetical protein
MDLATLGIVVDASQVPQAAAKLDQLTAAGAKAEAQVGSLATETRGASAAAAQYATDVQRMASNTRLGGAQMNEFGRATGAVRNNMLNLGYQINDIGVSLASGQNPFRVLVQQGSQVAQIFAQAGDSANEMAYRIGVLIGKWLPLAVAIGVGYAALRLFQAEMNDAAPADQFIKSLGLTDKEMKKLKDTTITTHDMFEGLWKAIAARTGWTSRSPTSRAT